MALTAKKINAATKYWDKFRKLPIGDAEMIMHLASFANECNNSVNIPSIEEFIEFWRYNGYNLEIAEQAYTGYYNNNWRDSNNKAIKNWQMKCRLVWFKPQHKIKDNQNITGKPSVLSDNQRTFDAASKSFSGH